MMEAYISEEQIISCDGVDELVAERIQPGHRTICSAKVNLEIRNSGAHTRTVKAKQDSCGSVSIAHENLMNEIKPAKKYKLPSIRLRGIGGKTNLLLTSIGYYHGSTVVPVVVPVFFHLGRLDV
jgi:hypothetical protein